MTFQPKDSTFEHDLWRMYRLTLSGMASAFDGWDGRITHPYAMGGDQVGYEIWERTCRIPYMLLLSGALPSELK